MEYHPHSALVPAPMPFRPGPFLLLALALLPPAAIPGTGDELARVERRLEDAPDDPRLLAEAGEAALEAGDDDKGLWYLTLALEAAPDDRDLAKSVATAMGAVERPEVDTEALFADYAETLFKLAKKCEGKKLYANAVDLLGRCRGTPLEEDAEARLEKILGKEKAVAALLASGIDVPTRTRKRWKAREIARLDAKHAAWEDAYEIKGKYYTVRTNMGYEMAHSIADAMEQVNTFYRRVFEYKQRGSTMRRCVLNVFATRDEFDRHTGSSPSVKGFYRPGENSVTTYDPRTEPRPRPLANLWSTLFHEASHQFTHAVWPNRIPAWLNEGTASYFEGARLEPNGTVSFNGIPDRRLKSAVALIRQGRPTVEQVVTYFEDGSYPGDYYPIGWGLVYFCHNFEDEHSERVYLPVYRAFMESYKSGGKHDVKARFVEYFVTKAGVKGVTEFKDFVRLWEDWIRDLAEIHFGGAEQADVLIARAAKELADGKPAQAVESLRWALRKRPDDPEALAALADVLAAEKHADAAMYHYRRLAALARAVPDPATPLPGLPERTAGEVLARALGGVAAIDPRVAGGLEKADAAFVEATVSAARRYAEVGLPRNAAHLLATARGVVGGDGRLAALAEEVSAGLDLRRWRRLHIAPGLEDWVHGTDWTSDGEAVTLHTAGLAWAVYRETPPASFRYEVAVHAGAPGKLPVYGLLFGSNPATGERLYVILPDLGAVGIVEFVDGVPELTDRFPANLDPDALSTTLAIEVIPGHVEFFVDGERVGAVDGGAELAGRVGLFGQDTEAVFEELRLRF